MSDIGDQILGLKNYLALSNASGQFISAAIDLAARVARTGLTPEHITRIDVAKLRELEADADSRLDALAAEHDAPASTDRAPSVYPEEP